MAPAPGESFRPRACVWSGDPFGDASIAPHRAGGRSDWHAGDHPGRRDLLRRSDVPAPRTTRWSSSARKGGAPRSQRDPPTWPRRGPALSESARFVTATSSAGALAKRSLTSCRSTLPPVAGYRQPLRYLTSACCLACRASRREARRRLPPARTTVHAKRQRVLSAAYAAAPERLASARQHGHPRCQPSRGALGGP